MPKISGFLQSCFPSRNGFMNRSAILNYLAASKLPVAKQFLQTYRAIGKEDARRLPFEAICCKAEVSSLELFTAVVMGAKFLKAQQSALKAILAHPDVIDATVENAKKEFGFSDRKMLHEAVGFLPTKQGSNIAINLLNQTVSKDDDEGDEEEDRWQESFPLISDRLEKWSEQRRQLTDGR